MKPFDPTKPFMRRDGTPARLLASDVRSHYNLSLIVAVMRTDCTETVTAYPADGIWPRETSCNSRIFDLVNIPEKIVVQGYMAIYRVEPQHHPALFRTGHVFKTAERCINGSPENYLAIIRIDTVAEAE